MIFKAALLYSTVLAALSLSALARPLFLGDGIETSNLYKRMEATESDPNREHAPSCLCIDCYANQMGMQPLQLYRGNDIFPKVLDNFCLVSNSVADDIVDYAEDKINAVQEKYLKKWHREWLKEQNVNPDSVRVVYRGGSSGQSSLSSRPAGDSGASSSRREDAMVPPQYVEPMDRVAENQPAQGIIRRRPGHRS